MKIICISGKARHGKDVTATMLGKSLEDIGYSVLIAHYGDLVKYICKTFFNWDGEKNEAGRGLLQQVGTDVVREQNPDFWVNFVRDILRFFPDKWDYVIIPDCRFPNEVYVMKDEFKDVIHIRVVRPSLISPLTAEQQAHISETALDDAAPDYLIYNTGTLEDHERKMNVLAGELATGLWGNCVRIC